MVQKFAGMFPSPLEVNRFISRELPEYTEPIGIVFPSPLEVNRCISVLLLQNPLNL